MYDALLKNIYLDLLKSKTLEEAQDAVAFLLSKEEVAAAKELIEKHRVKE